MATAPSTGPSPRSWAELGYASVTASLEAADDVLAMMPNPAAVLLHVPRRDTGGTFRLQSERLRERFAVPASR